MGKDRKKVGSITGIDRSTVPSGFGYEIWRSQQKEVKQAHQQVFQQLLTLSQLRLSNQTLVALLDLEKKEGSTGKTV